MVGIYRERLETLQRAMLAELEKVNDRATYLQHEGSSAKEVADMILEYESLLKTIQVCLNNGYRGLQVTWKRSTRADSYDSLEIEHNGEIDKTARSGMVLDLEFLLRCIDWLFEYQQKFSTTAKEAHKAVAEQNYLKRGESIEVNAVSYDMTAKHAASDNVQAKTTKDKLLSKTKQVSANLIRGNQVLQSAVLQSDLNLDELKEQTQSLSQANEKYSQLETVFAKTSQLVKTLENASHQEKRDVYLALGFMSLCVTWVLWRRIFKIPVKLFLWLVFRFFKAILVTIGLVKKVPIRPHEVMAPPAVLLEAATTTATPTDIVLDTIEQAVNEAMSRILTHDEL